MSNGLQPSIVLILDDDPDDLKFLAAAFAGVNPACQVGSFLNSGFLLSYLEQAPQAPDLIVLDLHMPGEDGLALAARLRKLPRLQQTPIALCTEFIDSTYQERLGELNLCALLIKPAQASAWIQQIQQLYGQVIGNK